jgi:glyoxylase-like metal-dependent hydrolase (beta-lactamase superfamily II)
VKTGRFDVDILHEGQMLVDGGIAFSGIPRSEWETFAPPDERNRVRFGLNQLLVRGEGINLLIDTGMGNKMRPRKREIMGLGSPSALYDNLARFGLKPDDITHVVFTHLHYDHCGGATEAEGDEIVPAFKNAMYFVQREEWDAAINPSEISRSSYCVHDFLPLQETGRLKLLNGDLEIAAGVYLEVSSGHTAGHQIVRIMDRELRVIFPGDICPTPFHLPPDRREAFDLFPADTIAARKILLKRSSRADTRVVFSHAAEAGFYRIEQKQNGFEALLCHEN